MASKNMPHETGRKGVGLINNLTRQGISINVWVCCAVIHDRPSGYWRPIEDTKGRPGRTIMAQVLIALHRLGGSSRLKRDRIHLNISQGSTRDCTWKLINLLVSVANRYIQLPTLGQRCVGATTSFNGSSDFLMGQIYHSKKDRNTTRGGTIAERAYIDSIWQLSVTGKSGLYMRTWVTLH